MQGWRRLLYSGHQLPNVTLLCAMSELAVRRAVEWFAEWLRDDDDDDDLGADGQRTPADTLLPTRRCAWLYALLACLETPLHADTAAALLFVVRTLSRRRVAAAARSDEASLTRYNVLLSALTGVFGQGRLPS